MRSCLFGERATGNSWINSDVVNCSQIWLIGAGCLQLITTNYSTFPCRPCHVTWLLVDSFQRTKLLHGNTTRVFFFSSYFTSELLERCLCLKMAKMLLYSTRAYCCSSQGEQCAYCVVTLLLFLGIKLHVHWHRSSVNFTFSWCEISQIVVTKGRRRSLTFS